MGDYAVSWYGVDVGEILKNIFSNDDAERIMDVFELSSISNGCENIIAFSDGRGATNMFFGIDISTANITTLVYDYSLLNVDDIFDNIFSYLNNLSTSSVSNELEEFDDIIDMSPTSINNVADYKILFDKIATEIKNTIPSQISGVCFG